MLKLFLWLRYLRKKKIVLLSIAAVALSVGLLIVVASLFSGFIEAVEKTGKEVFGDIYLNPWVRIPEYSRFLERLESLPEVEAGTAVFNSYGLLHLGRGVVKGVSVLGIEPVSYSKVTGLKENLFIHKSKQGEVGFTGRPGEVVGFVGIGVLMEPDVETDEYDFEEARKWIGREVVLTTGTITEKETAGGKTEPIFRRRTLKFTIADIVFTGMYLRDSKDIYLPIEQTQQLTETDGPLWMGPHEVIQIKLTEGIEPVRMVEPVRELWEGFAREHNLPEYSISKPILDTSKGMQVRFIAELKKQMAVLILIFGTVCSAAVVLIFCIFYMLVMTKQKDIAIIKSCGATNVSVVWIFAGFGGCVGIVGSAVGTVLGYVVIKNINAIEQWVRIISGLKLWKSSVYVFEKIPNQLNLSASGWIILFAILAAAIGAFIPAIVAARTQPVQILRYE
jgi:lipoprotein-releasing system permease protein